MSYIPEVALIQRRPLSVMSVSRRILETTGNHVVSAAGKPSFGVVYKFCLGPVAVVFAIHRPKRTVTAIHAPFDVLFLHPRLEHSAVPDRWGPIPILDCQLLRMKFPGLIWACTFKNVRAGGRTGAGEAESDHVCGL